MTVFIGPSAFAADWQPVASLRLLGGQYAFRGAPAGVSGNAELRLAVAAVFSPEWSLLASLDAAYEGTKPLSHPVGPGSLFQQRMTYVAGLKPVFSPKKSLWRFKPSLRYRMEFLRETRDERWNRGLFDSQTAILGMEAERVYGEDGARWRIGVDYAFIRFPRYLSLESQSLFDFNGAPLARELVGDKVLDSVSQTLYTAFSGPVPLPGDSRFDASVSFERRRFGSQPVVGSNGSLKGQSRIDLVTRAMGRVTSGRELRRELTLILGLGFSVMTTVSNQNRYDAGQGVFLPRFYNVFEWGISPTVGVELGDDRRPVVISLATQWTERAWGHRRTQTASGRYTDNSVSQRVLGVSLKLNYPLGTRLRFIGEIETTSATSNQEFEQFYRQNYGALSVLTGIGLDF